MWFRFLGISMLNTGVTAVATILLAAFILPAATPTIVLSLIIWVCAFLSAFLCSELAFSKRLPDRNDIILLVGIHLVVFLTFYTTYGIFLSDKGPWFVVAPEIVAQLVLEGIAICVAGYRMRRQRLRSVLGEGMTI